MGAAGSHRIVASSHLGVIDVWLVLTLLAAVVGVIALIIACCGSRFEQICGSPVAAPHNQFRATRSRCSSRLGGNHCDGAKSQNNGTSLRLFSLSQLWLPSELRRLHSRMLNPPDNINDVGGIML